MARYIPKLLEMRQELSPLLQGKVRREEDIYDYFILSLPPSLSLPLSLSLSPSLSLSLPLSLSLSQFNEDGVKELAYSLEDGSIFEIVKELEEIQQLNERSLLNQRIKVSHFVGVVLLSSL